MCHFCVGSTKSRPQEKADIWRLSTNRYHWQKKNYEEHRFHLRHWQKQPQDQISVPRDTFLSAAQKLRDLNRSEWKLNEIHWKDLGKFWNPKIYWSPRLLQKIYWVEFWSGTYFNLSFKHWCFYELGNYQECIDQCKKSLSISTTLESKLYGRIAKSFFFLKNYNDAITYIKLFFETKQTDPALYFQAYFGIILNIY
jgi:hypothetical protein